MNQGLAAVMVHEHRRILHFCWRAQRTYVFTCCCYTFYSILLQVSGPMFMNHEHTSTQCEHQLKRIPSPRILNPCARCPKHLTNSVHSCRKRQEHTPPRSDDLTKS
jgi:hypothetical protein